MRERLEAHGAAPSIVKRGGGILGALAKLPLDMVRGEKAGRNARDGYATEHMEIASYELLEAHRAARGRRGDRRTACDEILAQEHTMAKTIAANWDTFAELSLRESGVTIRLNSVSRTLTFNQGARKRSISFEPRGLSSRARDGLLSTTTSVGVSSIPNFSAGRAAPPARPRSSVNVSWLRRCCSTCAM